MVGEREPCVERLVLCTVCRLMRRDAYDCDSGAASFASYALRGLCFATSLESYGMRLMRRDAYDCDAGAAAA